MEQGPTHQPVEHSACAVHDRPVAVLPVVGDAQAMPLQTPLRHWEPAVQALPSALPGVELPLVHAPHPAQTLWAHLMDHGSVVPLLAVHAASHGVPLEHSLQTLQLARLHLVDHGLGSVAQDAPQTPVHWLQPWQLLEPHLVDHGSWLVVQEASHELLVHMRQPSQKL